MVVLVVAFFLIVSVVALPLLLLLPRKPPPGPPKPPPGPPKAPPELRGDVFRGGLASPEDLSRVIREAEEQNRNGLRAPLYFILSIVAEKRNQGSG